MPNRTTGTVKWFNADKGYGFVITESGDEVFVHYRQIAGGGYPVLTKGQRVSFAITSGTKGLQAEQVQLI